MGVICLKGIDLNKTKEFYEGVDNVWANSPWYRYSYSKISNYLKNMDYIQTSSYILNAGSAGNNYNLKCRMHHIDIAENKISMCSEYTVDSIEHMPFENNTFDGVICVGSVLNYTDAISSISEMIRVTKPNGTIIVEFENSNSLEYEFTKDHKKDATIIRTLYLDQLQAQWIYSYKYIISIINSFNVKIEDIYGFHIFDSLFANNEKVAIKLSKLDALVRLFPSIKKFAGNVIVRFKKL